MTLLLALRIMQPLQSTTQTTLPGSSLWILVSTAIAGCEDIVGCEDGGVRDSDRSIGSGWHPEPMRASPFTAYGLQDKYAVERKDSGQFAITPPDSCTEEELQCRPLARHGSLRSQGAGKASLPLSPEQQMILLQLPLIHLPSVQARMLGMRAEFVNLKSVSLSFLLFFLLNGIHDLQLVDCHPITRASRHQMLMMMNDTVFFFQVFKPALVIIMKSTTACRRCLK